MRHAPAEKAAFPVAFSTSIAITSIVL